MKKYFDEYTKAATREYSRFKSWEYVYGYVKNNQGSLLKKSSLEKTALHLGYYLASWGMFRGGGKLLYMNLEYFKFLSNLLFKEIPKRYPGFYDNTFSDFSNPEFCHEFDEVIVFIREEMNLGKAPTDTLTSKILLGVWGHVPALDNYFRLAHKDLLRRSSFKCRSNINLSGASMSELLDLSNHNEWPKLFREVKFSYEGKIFKYPLAKRIDMAFWQFGFKLVNTRKKALALNLK